MKKPRTISEFVYEQLKGSILSGKYKPGERLTEVNLAEELDVSRTPIRDAFNRLQAENLITVNPRHGIFVTEFSKEEIQNYYEVRAVLEGLAAKLAATNASDEDRAIFLNFKNKMNEVFERDKDLSNYETLAKSNDDFHKLICKLSKNEVVTRMLASLNSVITLGRTTSWTNSDRKYQTHKEHNRIATAILEKDSELAKKMAEEHIYNAWDSTRTVLDQKI